MNSLTIRRFPALSYACAEAINTLCTNLSFSGENVRKIMITSCHASEGKSFLSMNVMRTMAKLGKSVVLVDADLRRSMIASRYSLQFAQADNNYGLSHYLVGMADEEQILYRTNIAGAYMVPVGREVSNSLPLLVSARFDKLLARLAQKFTCVLVDAPPLGAIIDAAEIAKSCDGSLIVVNYNAVHRQELIDVKNQLEQTGCPILGTVLNRVEFDSYVSRKYYNKYYDKSYYSYDRRDLPSRPSAKATAAKAGKKK